MRIQPSYNQLFTCPYSFQAQEHDDEVAGNGNSYTAEFWQYDSRLGRRWNIDPVFKEHESPYACFANNPIWITDPTGADSSLYDSNTGKFITKGITEKDDKTAIWIVDSKKDYDPKNPWANAEKLKYSVGKGQKTNIGKKHLRKEHPLADKGWNYNAQVYEEDLLDMTKEFNSLLNKEKSTFKNKGQLFDDSWVLTENDKMLAFAALVKPNGPYDLKSQSRTNLDKIPCYGAVFIGQYSLYSGRLMSNDDYGNIAYGYWGKSYGYGLLKLCKAASVAQYLDTGKPDPPRDTGMIRVGFLLNK
jgi:RHS repeat-associated protein